jgi:serine/threonine-protein kinase
MRQQAGDVLNENLVLVRELGRGAMGSVWVAQNRALGAEVAVKLVDRVDSPEACARFETEARGLAQIDSPHVVRVFDYGITAHGCPFIVMELLRGEDLGARLRRAGTLDLPTTAEIIRQSCLALGRAHALGAVHRDIKPANIFLCEAEGAIFVKVLDFGVAKFATAANLDMTSTGVLMGTPYYMSPEQLMDPRSIDHRADLWSLGVVAYTCLSGSVPFAGETLGALSVAIHLGSYPPLTQARRDVPQQIEAWIARALQINREQRFGSAAEMAQALALISVSLSQFPLSASAPTSQLPPVSAPAPSAAAPQALAPAASSSLAPTANGTLAPTGAGMTQPGGGPPPVVAATPAPVPAPRRGMAGWHWALIALAILAVGAGAFALGARGDKTVTASAEKAAASKKKKKKTKKEPDEEPPEGDASAIAPAPAPAPPPAAAPSAEPPAPSASPPPAPSSAEVVPAPAPKPKPKPWRRRGDTCAKHDSTKYCTPCCRQPGDVMTPYPDCACTFDGEKWDREHGR